MTIGVRTPGGWAEGSTSLTVTPPTSVASGDMMILFVGAKPYNATIATPSGWTRIGTQQTNGSTASGVDSGSVTWSFFYKVAGGSESNISVTVTSGNVAVGCAYGFTRTKPSWATPTGYWGSDTSSDTSYSITAASSSGLFAPGDMALHASVLNGDIATASSAGITGTGLTFGTVTESPADYGATTGDDAEGVSAYASVSSGTSSADLVATFTLSSARTGGGGVIRLREQSLVYYVIYPSSKGTPTATQIKAGQDADGGTATASGSEAAPTTTGQFTFAATATGLTIATTYKIAFVWSDGTNNSNVSESATWATNNTGTLAATDVIDTVAFSGQSIRTGTLAATDTIDTVALAGKVKVQGTLSPTDTKDTVALTGQVKISGTLTPTDTKDTVAFTGKVKVQGTLAATDTIDTVALLGGSGVGRVGYLAATDTADIFYASDHGIVVDPGVGLDTIWTPELAATASWARELHMPNNWTREAR